MNLAEAAVAWVTRPVRSTVTNNPLSFQQWVDMFSYNGVNYPLTLQQTLGGKKEETPEGYAGYVQSAYRSNGVIYACMMARLRLFSQARFQFQTMRDGQPGELFGTPELALLERPEPGKVTGDLLARALLDADLAGNFFMTRRPGRLKRLPPTWVSILLGSFKDPSVDAYDIDAEVLGYVYFPGGKGSGSTPVTLLRDQVAHFAPYPDPLAQYRGMSWLTPVMREIMADSAATTHKLNFFENGATPNMVVSLDPGIGKDAFDKWITTFRSDHEGLANAYKTLYLGGGAKVEVVGSNLQQLDFKITQGAGETRIAAAAGVPPVIVGLSEGLQAATYSNYGQARRSLADTTLAHLWQNFASSAEVVVRPPNGSQLVPDTRHIPFLREDAKDQAEIQGLESRTIRTLVDAGYLPESVISAVRAQDWKLLRHSGLYSVQLQPPQPDGPPVPGPAPRGLDDAGYALLRSLARQEPPLINVHPAAAPDVHIDAPTEVHLPEMRVEVNPTPVEIHNDVAVEPTPLEVTVEAPTVTVEAPEVHNEITVGPTPVEVSVEAPNVTVTAPSVTVEAPEIHNDITVEPTPVTVTNEVTVPEASVEVHVEPTPVEVHNQVTVPGTTRKKVVRDERNQIVEIVTDGD